MLTNFFVSNYGFVDDKGIDVSLKRINVVLGVSSVKAALFMAPCLLGGVMSNLNVRYTTPKISFGSFEEIVYNGSTSKPIILYLRFRNFRKNLHESFFSLLFSASPVAFDKYSDEFKRIDILDLYLEILGDRVTMLRLIINEHIMFSVARHEVWTWKIEIDKKTIAERSNNFPAVNFSGLLSGILDSIHYADIRSWFIERYQSLGTESMRSLAAKKLIDIFSDLESSQRLGTFLREAGDIAVRLKYIPPSSLGIEYRLSNSWKKTNFFDLDFISLLPTLAVLFGTGREDTVIILEPSIMSPRMQHALFRISADIALNEKKQIVFLTNSPIIVRELLNSDPKVQEQSKLLLVYYDDRAHIKDLSFDSEGIQIGQEDIENMRQFWTDDLINTFKA